MRCTAKLDIFPSAYFYDYLTAREFLDYCAQLFGNAKHDRKRRTTELLERVHLDKKSWDVQLRKFSRGMLQRVGLAQALVNDPAIVFLDEPMSGLDPVGRRSARSNCRSATRGKTVFMNSHILSDIEVLCDRVAILKRGKLAHVGHLDELRRRAGENDRVEVAATGTTRALVVAPARPRQISNQCDGKRRTNRAGG